MEKAQPLLTKELFDAVLFDLDGVLTDTAKVHAACWKKLFDAFLKKRAEAKDIPFEPFDIGTDYRLYVDGKPRYDGVRDFLKSRGIELPEGAIEDPPGEETILTAAVTLEAVLQHKAVIDVGAHYSRPDVLQLHVDRRPVERLVDRSLSDSRDRSMLEPGAAANHAAGQSVSELEQHG